jgi:hypothetical protein
MSTEVFPKCVENLNGTTWNIYNFHDGLEEPVSSGNTWQFLEGNKVQDPINWNGQWKDIGYDKIQITAKQKDGSTAIVDAVFVLDNYFVEVVNNEILHIGIRK